MIILNAHLTELPTPRSNGSSLPPGHFPKRPGAVRAAAPCCLLFPLGAGAGNCGLYQPCQPEALPGYPGPGEHQARTRSCGLLCVLELRLATTGTKQTRVQLGHVACGIRRNGIVTPAPQWRINILKRPCARCLQVPQPPKPAYPQDFDSLALISTPLFGTIACIFVHPKGQYRSRYDTEVT